MDFVKRFGALLFLITAAFILPGTASTASAAPVEVKPAANYCDAWISGEWGHGRCYNNSGSQRTAYLEVICSAWWDANGVYQMRIPAYSSTHAQHHCYSSVASVKAWFL